MALPALVGKKMVCFGDSITWYDGNNFLDAAKEEWRGKQAIGYESYLREALGGIVDNQGVSGNTSGQIMERVQAFDFSGYEAVTIFCGVNDWNKGRAAGTVAEIGGSFDTSTFAGAYQSMIEDIFERAPKIKMGLILPYKVWKNKTQILDDSYIDVSIEIAKLYSIPYFNLYDESGVNIVNRDTLFVDNPETGNSHFHLNNDGYALISPKIVDFVESIVG